MSSFSVQKKKTNHLILQKEIIAEFFVIQKSDSVELTLSLVLHNHSPLRVKWRNKRT